MSKITVNGITLELELMDADNMEKYEDLNKEISDKIAEPTQYEGLSGSEQMRIQCRHVDNFFNELFGEGTSERIFPSKNNLKIRMEAFGQASQMSTDIRNEIKNITNKYSPQRAANRDPKRYQQKHQKSHGNVSAYHK